MASNGLKTATDGHAATVGGTAAQHGGGGEAVGASNFRRVLQHRWGEAERNTSTDGGYLLLSAVWDCGIDGVETDLSLCLAHGGGAAAIPRGAVRGH